MARCAASYILMLDEQSSQAQNVLHKNAFSDEALFRFTPQYEASSFHSDMKHSAHAPYDEKMKNERVVFANIPYQCYIIQWKGKFSWKNLQTNSLTSLSHLLLKS